MLDGLREHLMLRLGAVQDAWNADRMRPARLVTLAVVIGMRGDRPAAGRALSLAAGRSARGTATMTDARLELVADALESSLVGAGEQVVVLGPDRKTVAAGLRSRYARVEAVDVATGGPGAVVLAGVLERLTASAAAELLATCRETRTVVALVPLWPAAAPGFVQAGGPGTLRTRRWWLGLARGAGLDVKAELRSAEAGFEALVLRSAPGPTRTMLRPATATTTTATPLVRINDDLSMAGSFAWITASIAAALVELGVPVSVAPTGVSASFPVERRKLIESLLETRAPSSPPPAEIGWTHFWWRYRRKLGGDLALPLFAINYGFTRADPQRFDPWMRGLLSERSLAPISAFCRDVLVEAGVPASRTHVIPMGFTEGLDLAEPGELPRARALRLLHVTNATDVERNGTDLALAAFEAAFGPADDVTLVLRDYGGRSQHLADHARRLTDLGHDVRYWPVFFPEDRLGSFLGAFDALLAPFRGEGFGIKILDAMVCGVAPICPFFGGPRDFIDESVAFRVEHDLVGVATVYDAGRLDLGNGPRWAECRHQDLVRTLRAVLERPEEARRRGGAARERALGSFSWKHTARRIAAMAS